MDAHCHRQDLSPLIAFDGVWRSVRAHIGARWHTSHCRLSMHARLLDASEILLAHLIMTILLLLHGVGIIVVVVVVVRVLCHGL